VSSRTQNDINIDVEATVRSIEARLASGDHKPLDLRYVWKRPPLTPAQLQEADESHNRFIELMRSWERRSGRQILKPGARKVRVRVADLR